MPTTSPAGVTEAWWAGSGTPAPTTFQLANVCQVEVSFYEVPFPRDTEPCVREVAMPEVRIVNVEPVAEVRMSRAGKE